MIDKIKLPDDYLDESIDTDKDNLENLDDINLSDDNVDDNLDNNIKEHSDISSEKKTTKKKKKRKSKLMYNIIMFILLCVFVTCAYILIKYFLDSKKSEDKVEELKELVDDDYSFDEEDLYSTATDAKKDPEYVDVNGVAVQSKFEAIYRQNNDFIGWIYIEDTDIDYPVVQSMYEEEYYIHKDFDKEYSQAGTLFIDTSCNVAAPSDNIMIYGHNMKTGKMFHDLLEYEDEEFYKEHKYIIFNTIYGDGVYEVIAAYRTKIHPVDYTGFKYYQFFNASSEEEFDNYVTTGQANTPYEIESTATYGDRLLTLSTCAYHDDNGRYVVVAKKVQ